MNQEVKFAEAVAELVGRLERAGVDGARETGQEFMRWLLHAGWRPVAPESWKPRHPEPTTEPTSYADLARQLMRESRAGLCAHGVPRDHCVDHRDQPGIEDVETKEGLL